MQTINLYDEVHAILKENVRTRSDDRLLYWALADRLQLLSKHHDSIRYWDLYQLPPMESIIRTRRMVQKKEKKLIACPTVYAHRKRLAKQKGTHVFRVKVAKFTPHKKLKRRMA